MPQSEPADRLNATEKALLKAAAEEAARQAAAGPFDVESGLEQIRRRGHLSSGGTGEEGAGEASVSRAIDTDRMERSKLAQAYDPSVPSLSIPSYNSAHTFSDTTRRLCGAMHLNPELADEVIREVVEEDRRTVPPSYGFDLDPVARHALLARRHALLRYAVVAAVLLVALILDPLVLLTWLTACALVVGTQSATVRALARGWRIVVNAVAGVAALTVVGLSASYRFIAALMSGDPLPSLSRSWLLAVGVAVISGVALFVSRRRTFDLIVKDLAPGAAASAPRTGSDRVEQRLKAVAASQRGNILVHEGKPFLGAGNVEHAWSFTVPLNSQGDLDRPRRVSIDIHELYKSVADRANGLRGAHLTVSERIPNVYVVPFVVADGYRRWDDPLLSPHMRVPMTQASPEALAAIAGSPQGGLRHYLRVVVPSTGKEIRTGEGRSVLPAQDSGIGVTAFVHFAVEGGLLYTEFVATVMPPLNRSDDFGPEHAVASAARDTIANLAKDNLFAAPRLVRLGWNAMRLPARMAQADRRADEARVHQYGARVSVRELAADHSGLTPMQVLDAGKYIKVIERAVSEGVVEFLEAYGVDTAELRTVFTHLATDSTRIFTIGTGGLSGGSAARTGDSGRSSVSRRRRR